MIAEETCASHELSSAKITADFSEPPLNPGRKEARGSIALAIIMALPRARRGPAQG
jgi:hypothetical protein